MPGRYTGWDDQRLADNNEGYDLVMSHVDADVMKAIQDGYKSPEEIAELTGYTRGQVVNATRVLAQQGLIRLLQPEDHDLTELEDAVLRSINAGHEGPAAITEATGYTREQVDRAASSLARQGLIKFR